MNPAETAFPLPLLRDRVPPTRQKKPITHVTGAQIQFADREVIDAIVQRAASSDHGLRTLLHEVIQSRVFTHK